MTTNGLRATMLAVVASVATMWTTDVSAQNTLTDLGGTSWQLVKFQSSDDTTLTPDHGSKYTITFGNDGRVSARIDCNRGSGTWKSDGPNQLLFGPLALTRAMWPPGSLQDRIEKDWSAVRSYIVKDGHLFLSLMADGGIIAFDLAYDPQRIDSRGRYSIQVRVLDRNKLRFTNTQAYPVITHGHPNKVNVIVKPVGR